MRGYGWRQAKLAENAKEISDLGKELYKRLANMDDHPAKLGKDPAKNPLEFEWKGEEFPVRCLMLGEINEATGLSVLVDIGEVMGGFGMPTYTYRNSPRRPGLTVEQSIDGLGKVGLFSEIGVQVPDVFVMNCIRLCCSLCLLENDPSVISPDVLADDPAKFERG